MRSAIILLFCFSLSSHWATCQVMGYGADGTDGYGTQSTANRRARLPRDTAYYTLEPNQLWSRQQWKDSLCSFANFQYGRLEFADGSTQTGKWKMNYNYFLENVVVQLETKDVVGLAKYAGLKSISIGNHKLHYDTRFGFIEVVQEGTIRVAVKRMMHCVMENSNGHKHLPYLNEDPRGALSRETRYYWPYEAYFIIAPDGYSYRANPITLRQMLPHLDGKLKIFSRINNINFRNVDDIKRFIEYCNKNYTDPAAQILSLDDSESIETSKWKDRLYMFPTFESPRMTLDNGKSVDSDLKMNYNLLTGWMNSVNKKGDTVLFTTTTTHVLTMVMDEATFFNDRTEGPMEVVILGKLGLGRKPRIEFLGRNAIMAADTVVRYEKKYAYKDRFFFLVRGKAVPADEKTITILFPGDSDKIEEYILVNNINFGFKEDLLKLIGFCQQLSGNE